MAERREVMSSRPHNCDARIFFFLNPRQRIFCLLLFRETGGGERERNIDDRDIDWLQALTPGLESNLRPFSPSEARILTQAVRL